MGAALCWAVAMLVVRRWPPRSSMLELLPWAFALATVALLPMALAHDVGHWDAAGAEPALAAIGLRDRARRHLVRDAGADEAADRRRLGRLPGRPGGRA